MLYIYTNKIKDMFSYSIVQLRTNLYDKKNVKKPY